MVKYVYDAWGNHLVLDANGDPITDMMHIGHRNPFRYRGYYYDRETGLYYLKSRYYDPVVGRFISPDSVEYLDPKTINGLNLYAYCRNNPVMCVDPSGHMPEWAKWVIGGAVIVASVAATILTGGAAAGTIAASVHVIATGAMVGAATSAAIGTIAGGVTYENGSASWDWSGAAQGFMSGAITGAISGALGSVFSNVGSGLAQFGKIGKLGYAGIQGAINAGISGTLTAMQGLITNSFSWANVGISAAFGMAGGVAGITKFGQGIRGIFVGAGLNASENAIGEIFEYNNSFQASMAYLQLIFRKLRNANASI